MRFDLLLLVALCQATAHAAGIAPGSEIQIDVGGPVWQKAVFVRQVGDKVHYRVGGSSTLRQTDRGHVHLAGEKPAEPGLPPPDLTADLRQSWFLSRPPPDDEALVAELEVGPGGDYLWVPREGESFAFIEGKWIEATEGGVPAIVLGKGGGGKSWRLTLDPQAPQGEKQALLETPEGDVLVGHLRSWGDAPGPEASDAAPASPEPKPASDADCSGKWSLSFPEGVETPWTRPASNAGELSILPEGQFYWAFRLEDSPDDLVLDGRWRQATREDLPAGVDDGLVLHEARDSRDWLVHRDPDPKKLECHLVELHERKLRLDGALQDK